ncbi:TPA: hypothetical protein U5E40_000817 [Yersinia enterocolitica]|nr:hypothetical protein [Yersinia enterocolitica]
MIWAILAPAGDTFGDCPTIFHALLKALKSHNEQLAALLAGKEELAAAKAKK